MISLNINMLLYSFINVTRSRGEGRMGTKGEERMGTRGEERMGTRGEERMGT